jgi:hypothetical protein
MHPPPTHSPYGPLVSPGASHPLVGIVTNLDLQSVPVEHHDMPPPIPVDFEVLPPKQDCPSV